VSDHGTPKGRPTQLAGAARLPRRGLHPL